MSTTVTKTQKVGMCPRCAVPIFGEVDLAVEHGTPFLRTGETRWAATAHVDIVAVRVEHQCAADTDEDEEDE